MKNCILIIFLFCSLLLMGQNTTTTTSTGGSAIKLISGENITLVHSGTTYTINASGGSSLPDTTGKTGQGLIVGTSNLEWAPLSGAGTVTSFTVTTSNGVSATVSNPSTTPVATFSLGAITPSTINGNKLVSGTGTLTITGNSSISGVNTGDQTTISGNAGSATIAYSLTNGGSLNTPGSGNLVNCTFPTLNQNTTGTAGGLLTSATPTVTSLTSTTTITTPQIATISSTPLIFGTNNTERARILSTGELGIGTTTSSTKLEVVDSDNSTAIAASFAAIPITLRNKNTTVNNWTQIGFFGGATNNVIAIIGTQNTSTTNGYGDIVFATRSVGGLTEKARLLSTGEFLVGGTATVASELLSVQKNQNAGTAMYVSNSTSGTGAYSAVGALTNGATSAAIRVNSPGFTNSGINVASTTSVYSTQLSGMNLGTVSNTQLSFWTNNTQKVQINANGGVVLIGGNLYMKDSLTPFNYWKGVMTGGVLVWSDTGSTSIPTTQ